MSTITVSSFARRLIDVPKRLKKPVELIVSLSRFRFHTWSRNRSHRDSDVEIFTFADTFSQFLCYWNIVMGLASEQENLCSDRLPKSAKCVFFWSPSLIPKKEKKKRNACSLLNTSYNVVTKQFIFAIWIKAFPVFLVERWGHRFVPNENNTKQNKNNNETSRFIW